MNLNCEDQYEKEKFIYMIASIEIGSRSINQAKHPNICLIMIQIRVILYFK